MENQREEESKLAEFSVAERPGEGLCGILVTIAGTSLLLSLGGAMALCSDQSQGVRELGMYTSTIFGTIGVISSLLYLSVQGAYDL